MKPRINAAKLAFSFLIFSVACSCIPAFAQGPAKVLYPFKSGFFVDVGYGLLSRDRTVELGGTQWTTWHRGTVMGGKVGYRWENGIRVELERSRIRNYAALNRPAGMAEGDADGYSDINPTMLNVSYDWGFRGKRLAPYLGFGFGKYTVNLRGLSSPAIRSIGPFLVPPVSGLSLSDDAPAENCRQAMAGVNYRVNSRFEVHAGYRYFKGNDFDLSFPVISTLISPPGPIYRGVEFGVRYLF